MSSVICVSALCWILDFLVTQAESIKGTRTRVECVTKRQNFAFVREHVQYMFVGAIYTPNLYYMMTKTPLDARNHS